MTSHITPILASLQWLPVTLRADLKFLLITYKALHGRAPEYITKLLVPYQPLRPLRSSAQTLPAVPRSRLKTKGDRFLPVRAHRLWNSRPVMVRSAESVVCVHPSHLKSHFMGFIL